MKITTKILDQSELETFAKNNLVNIPIEQTEIWQKFDNSVDNRKAIGVYGFFESEKQLAIATITEYKNNRYYWWWVKFGPIFADSITDNQKRGVLLKIKAMAKMSKQNIVFVRVTTPRLGLKMSEQLQHMSYDKTVTIDLKMADNDKILANMTRHGRYEVRKAIKTGVKCQKVPNVKAISNFDDYYKIIEETAKRDGFYALPKETYIKMLKNLNNNTAFFVASYKNQPVAWAIVSFYDKYSKYYYAAGNTLAREVGAAYALQYFILQQLRDMGVETYDLMGIGSDDWPDIENVSTFKKKFSNNIVDLDKTYDMVCSPLKYNSLKMLKKLKKLAKR
jgi:lipid II:glycine glycyltransferase (peptidoglycan interpeptide bridge formation enzyme)